MHRWDVQIVDAEDLEFCMSEPDRRASAEGSAFVSGAASVVLEGLRCMMPLLTDGLLGYPLLAKAFLNVVSQLVLNHAAQVCMAWR
jgi:hypothetical protein